MGRIFVLLRGNCVRARGFGVCGLIDVDIFLFVCKYR